MSATPSAFPTLFSELSLGPHRLKNRIAQSAFSTAYAKDGKVTERLIAFHQARARGGVAMIVTEALAGHSAQQVGSRVKASDEANYDGLARWAEAVETHGCRLLGQLFDPGRGRHHPGRNPHAIGASPLPDDLSWTVPHVLSIDDIRHLVDEFARTADRLRRAGFSGVELSCGHGHLFHQFLSPWSNRREDAYGGDVEGRTRLVRELCEAIRATCGRAFIVGAKLPGDDGVPGGVDPDESERILRRLLVLRQFDYFGFAGGSHHRSLEMHIPDLHCPPAPYRHITARMRRIADGTPVVAVGKITTPEEAEGVLAKGKADVVMMGRALFADAGWALKAREGREREIRLCINGNTCWGELIGGRPAACDANPHSGTPGELDWQPGPARGRKRIVIVGSGVAGLEAAWTAAARGHDVTVLAVSSEVGGKTRLHASVPGCGQLARLYDFQRQAAERAGVRFVLGRRAGLDDILGLDPQAVVLATGSRMSWPEPLQTDELLRDLRDVVSDLLRGDRPGGTAVIYDVDHTAGTYDAAEMLGDRFDRVVLLTPREQIARDVPLVTRQSIYRRMCGKGIDLVLLSEPTRFAGGRLAYRNVLTALEADISDVALLTYATPRLPNDDLADPLRRAGVDVHLVGDCYAPRFMLSAVHEGHRIGNAL